MDRRFYFILLKKDEDCCITNIVIPDFPQIKLVADPTNKLAVRSDSQAATIVINKINQHIETLQLNNRGIPEPSSYEAVYSKYKPKNNDVVIGVPIHVTPKKGFFARWLPRIGAVCAVASAIAGAVVSTVGLKSAMKDSDDQTGASAYSIFQSTVNGGIGVVIYFYAKSSKGLENAGHKLDGLFRRKKFVPELDSDELLAPQKTDCKSSTKIIITRLAFTGIVVSNIVSNAIGLNEQLTALAEHAKEETDTLVPYELLLISIWVLISTGSISGLSFIGAMVAQLEQDLAAHYRSQIAYEIMGGQELTTAQKEPAFIEDADDEKQKPVTAASVK